MSAGSPVPGMLEKATSTLETAKNSPGLATHSGHSAFSPSYSQAHIARRAGMSFGKMPEPKTPEPPLHHEGGIGTTGSPVPSEEATSIKSKIDNAKAAGLSDQ